MEVYIYNSLVGIHYCQLGTLLFTVHAVVGVAIGEVRGLVSDSTCLGSQRGYKTDKLGWDEKVKLHLRVRTREWGRPELGTNTNNSKTIRRISTESKGHSTWQERWPRTHQGDSLLGCSCRSRP